jgi:hypothetical protein
MRLDTYEFKYMTAYQKLESKGLNMMAEPYSKEQLKEAYDIYSNTSLWYHRAFKPSILASTNVIYYDYQLRTTFPDMSDEEIRQLIEEDSAYVDKTVREVFFHRPI